MCPMCLTTFGLYVAGGLSAGGFTTYLATKVLRKGPDRHAADRPLGLEASKLHDSGAAPMGEWKREPDVDRTWNGRSER